jgi:hypothetical protein
MSEHLDRRMLEAYVEQSLSALDRRAVEAHVTTCPRCQAGLAAAKQLTALLYDLPRERPAADLTTRIAAAVAAGRVPLTSPWLRALAPAAFALACVLLSATWPQWGGWAQAVLAQVPTAETALAWWWSVLSDPALALDEMATLFEAMVYTQESNVLFIVSMLLLALASVSGLAQLLGEPPQSAARAPSQAWGRG